LVPQAQKVLHQQCLVQLALQVQLALLAQLEQVVLSVLQALLDQQVLLVILDQQASVQLELLDRKELKAQQVLQVHKVLSARLVPLAHKDHKEFKAKQEQLAL
jgi:hypothetical protein